MIHTKLLLCSFLLCFGLGVSETSPAQTGRQRQKTRRLSQVPTSAPEEDIVSRRRRGDPVVPEEEEIVLPERPGMSTIERRTRLAGVAGARETKEEAEERDVALALERSFTLGDEAQTKTDEEPARGSKRKR